MAKVDATESIFINKELAEGAQLDSPSSANGTRRDARPALATKWQPFTFAWGIRERLQTKLLDPT